MFNLSNGTWTPLQTTREPRQAASSVVYNHKFFVIGGYVDCLFGGTKSVETLSINAVEADQSITWKNFAAKLPGPLQQHCSLVFNRRLIMIGGYDSDKDAYSDSITEVSLVPPYTKKLLATMPQTREYLGAALFGDKILILGERAGGYGTHLKTVLLYDITKNECKELAPLPYPVSQMAAVKWGDDNVIIMGGMDSNNKGLNKVIMYNVNTQKSHTLPNLKYKRKGCVAAVVRDTVIVMGGQDDRWNCLKSVEGFKFDRNTWEELPHMHEARHLATAVVC